MEGDVHPLFREFLLFGLKQARACIFAGSFFLLLLASKHLPLFGLPRYDFIFLAAVVLQIVLVWTGIESMHELMTLCAFHTIGLGLELFKTHPAIASWSYPGEGYLKLGTVPLYSGFMYAAVASYMCQAWRLLKFELFNYPPYRWSVPLAAAIYLNFFTNHYIMDVRWVLIPLVFVVFRKTWIGFTPAEKQRKMPLVLAIALVAFFVWVAENISTFLGAWVYPQQREGWSVVSVRIMSSWFLLVIISGIIVADLKHVREAARRRAAAPASLPGIEEEKTNSMAAGTISSRSRTSNASSSLVGEAAGG
jgi:uncharacterized membrane protein YoaT (DUF817 family)